MKFRVRSRDDYKLHEWFAWYPVHVGDDNYVWLEKVYRCKRGSYADDYWAYTEIEKDGERES